MFRERRAHGFFGTRVPSRILSSFLSPKTPQENLDELNEQVKKLLADGKVREAFDLSQKPYEKDYPPVDYKEYQDRVTAPGTPSQDGDIF